VAFDTIRYADRDGWMHVPRNRPETLDAVDAAVHDELAAVLEQVRRDGARALLLSAEGDGVAAGQDLREGVRATLDERESVFEGR